MTHFSERVGEDAEVLERLQRARRPGERLLYRPQGLYVGAFESEFIPQPLGTCAHELNDGV
ncbi:hypothetical protein ACKI1J_48375, partial [Streptomyces scabiei]|uniref:hypothetical protein n=1 Tax=Streptomyces scabiei TaxID=1930 RepID=UPI0039F13051